MRSVVVLLALSIIVVGHARASDERDEGLSVELWDALGTVLPERWTAKLRGWNSWGDIVVFETPLTQENERLGVQRLYTCSGKPRWRCVVSEELHVEANGMRHRMRVEKVPRELILKVADYVYSPCFYAQRKQLGEAARAARWHRVDQPIYFLMGIGGNMFSVATGGGSTSVSYRFEVDSETASDCGFKLRSVGAAIVQPNRPLKNAA